jgi:archaemetzincin
MHEFFNLRVELKPELPMPDIPAKARRLPPGNIVAHERAKYPEGREQILAGYVINDILRPQLPADAAALIAFTASDLYPEESWYFVFGQASFRERVGVWSLHRLGTPDASHEEFLACLRRTMKLATHETGHMFSIPHCTKYECNMSGTNSLAETDRRPLDYCPECMAKICWATNANPRERYTKLAAFTKAHGLIDDERFFQTAIKALDNRPLAKVP